jgi:hypothetical protein
MESQGVCSPQVFVFIMNTDLYLRRRRKVILPAASGSDLLPIEVAATFSANLEDLGYVLSPDLIEDLRRLSIDQISTFYADLIKQLTVTSWSGRFKPFYLNFPQEVMELSKGELYRNAINHYHSNGQLFPGYRTIARKKLAGEGTLIYISLGSLEEFEQLFGSICGANTAFSQQDQLDIAWYVSHYKDDIYRLLPAKIPQRENLTFLAVQLFKETSQGTDFVREQIKTAHDVLRFATCLSGGHPSLAVPCKFVSFNRPTRRLLLEILEAHPRIIEEMCQRPELWKRLGERLHPSEYKRQFPKTDHAFSVVRNSLSGQTFSAQVEKAMSTGSVPQALSLLKTRPGELYRRLDSLLRHDSTFADQVVKAAEQTASSAATPLLLQVSHHFKQRIKGPQVRVFLPKGQVAKARLGMSVLPPISAESALAMSEAADRALIERFKNLPSLGRVFVDPDLKDFPAPFGTRSAQKSFKTLPRGSRLDLNVNKTLRLFLHWQNGSSRTDIDLSAVFFNKDMGYEQTVSYYNLETFGGLHSGDIVDAPLGASEYIDLNLSVLKKFKVRYVAMLVQSYTVQNFCELPHCFAGWMERKKPGSGEIYEPKTVEERLDLTAESTICIPVIFDLEEKKAIWTDLALKKNPYFSNNAASNLSGISLTLFSMLNLSKPTLYDLLSLHGRARGKLVETPEEADTVFSFKEGTPYERERLAKEFLA